MLAEISEGSASDVAFPRLHRYRNITPNSPKTPAPPVPARLARRRRWRAILTGASDNRGSAPFEQVLYVWLILRGWTDSETNHTETMSLIKPTGGYIALKGK